MVRLSGLDSNKCRAIIGFKKYIAEHTDTYSTPKETVVGDRETDEFGEVAAKRVRRIQKRLTPEETQELIKAYKSGKEPIELSEQFGIHRITVGKILKRNGISLRRTCPRKSTKQVHL